MTDLPERLRWTPRDLEEFAEARQTLREAVRERDEVRRRILDLEAQERHLSRIVGGAEDLTRTLRNKIVASEE